MILWWSCWFVLLAFGYYETNGLISKSFTKVSVYTHKIKKDMKIKGNLNMQNSIDCSIQCSRVQSQSKNCTGFYFEKKKCKLVSMSINDQFIPIYEEIFWNLPKGKVHVYLEDSCKFLLFRRALEACAQKSKYHNGRS